MASTARIASQSTSIQLIVGCLLSFIGFSLVSQFGRCSWGKPAVGRVPISRLFCEKWRLSCPVQKILMRAASQFGCSWWGQPPPAVGSSEARQPLPCCCETETQPPPSGKSTSAPLLLLLRGLLLFRRRSRRRRP